MRRRWLAAFAALLVAGCGSASAPLSTTGAASTGASSQVAASDYLPGLAARLFLPDSVAGRVPLVVLVPGGAWTSADPSGLAPLASDLAGRGVAVLTATYRTAADGVVFPLPVQDIACALAYGVRALEERGLTAGPVVLAGHSAGAQLASLVALAADRFTSGCPYAAAVPDGFVGLAGPYDITADPGLVLPLFGATPADHPEAWREGNPYTWVAGRPTLPVLLLHGSADRLVPPASSVRFGSALRDAGHPVRLDVVTGIDHQTVYEPGVAAPVIASWLRGLAPR